MSSNVASRLAAPVKLAPFSKDQDGQRVLNVVIETVRGGRNKLAYDEELGIFRLKKVLPEGMSFPYDFGFVPGTRGGDGDPLDALVLMDAPGATGCLVTCRLLGVIRGTQKEAGKARRERNDRLIAVAMPSLVHSDLRRIDDLNAELLRQVERFFVNYHAEQGQTFRAEGHQGPREAWRLVDDGARAWGRPDAPRKAS